jgi:plasmid stabilization system protein ParE
MAPHRYTSRADADLLDIWQFIAADNPQAADRLLLKIDEQCQFFGRQPRLGGSIRRPRARSNKSF